MKTLILSVILFVQLVSFINAAPPQSPQEPQAPEAPQPPSIESSSSSGNGGFFDFEQRRRCVDAMTRGIEELTTKLNEDIKIENQKLTELLSVCNNLPIIERLRCRREHSAEVTEINNEMTRLRRQFATNKMQILNDFYSCRVAGGSPAYGLNGTTDGLELPPIIDAIENQI